MSGEPVRGGVQARAGTRGDVGGILFLLALALTFRVIIAYLLPGSGFANDIGAFQFWATNLADEGLYGFYERPFLHDYTPGYLYVLWVVGAVGKLFGGVGDLIKVPPMVADVVLAYLVWSMARELGAGRWSARLGALIVAVNPITWLDSAIWGQVDSFGLIFLLLGLRELWRDRPERAAILTVIGAITKPQLGIHVPIVAAVTIRRALWPRGGFGAEEPPASRRSTTAWESRTRGRIRILTTGVAGFATAVAMSLPFGLSLPGLVEQIFKTAGGYPYLSVNAWNPWALVTFEGSGVAENRAWVCDMVVTAGETAARCARAFSFGPIPAVVVGTVLTFAAFIAVSVIVARRPDRRTILVGLAVLALVFFVVPTRVHERYLYPLVAIGAILAAVSARWTVAYVLSGVATLANMYFVLTTLYPNNPGIDDWLGIGPGIGSWPGVALAAGIQVAVLAFALTELRASAGARLAREIAASGLDDEARALPGVGDAGAGPGAMTGPVRIAQRGSEAAGAGTGADAGTGAVAGATTTALVPAWDQRPSSGEVGFVGWFRARLGERPVRPDRTAGLQHERGGGLDRLDLWMVLVLAAVLLTGRVWRLGEPVQMHFDEVYHPRTATEFLQAWRYGISHDIYEWTHPHLAKYAMALGIVAWGEDRTAATSELGVEVRSAAVEPRWDERSTTDRVAGDRLWIATGEEVRAYDLARRTLVASIPVPGATAVAVDRVGHRLVVGTSGGEIRFVDTAPLDEARWAGTLATARVANGPVRLGAPVRLVHVPADGASLVVVLGDSSGDAVSEGGGTVAVLDPTGATEIGRVELDGITGVADASTGLVALATAAGAAFVDTATASVTTTVALAGPARGLVLVDNLDKDRLYATYDDAEGPRVATITGLGAGETPTLETTFTLPGTAAGWIGYDVATQMIHVLGTTPDGGAPTVYVVEPHANAVYADAALPFEPA
ncbi:MAG TPA: hypothetical protein VLS28_00580, partial [Candidatus Sulfomarinibacteraceae bacterium]|nr:hypothetical protein [Candidatus Sulfomarinibacteraceae bacterium]